MANNIKRKTEDTLIRLGANTSNKGFRYICDAVELISKDELIPTCELYSAIAEKHNDKASRVERTIRNVISTLDAKKSSEYFGKDTKMSNGNAVHILAIKIGREIEND